MDGKLQVRLLGKFELEYKGRKLTLDGHQGEKVWKMLAYLLMYRGEPVTAEELYRAVEGVPAKDNPARRLKNLLFRLRKMMDELGHLPGSYLILYDNGIYSWNPRVECYFDIQVYWAWMDKAEASHNKSQKMQYYRNALKHYKGKFMADFFYYPWLQVSREWIETSYQIARDYVLQVLTEREDWQTLKEFCLERLPYDADAMVLQKSYVDALLQLQEKEEAFHHVMALQEEWQREYGVPMLALWPKIYEALQIEKHSGLIDLSFVQKQMQAEDERPGVFYVDMSIFRSMYQLSLRNVERYHQDTYLCQVSIKNRSPIGEDDFLQQQQWMENILRRCLRKGDLAACYCPNEYMLLLTVTDSIYLPVVFSRIQRAMLTDKPELSILFQYESMLEERALHREGKLDREQGSVHEWKS